MIRGIHQQACHFFLHNAVELSGTQVLVALHALTDAVNEGHRGFNAHIGAHQGLFQVIEHFLVDGGFAGYRLRDLREKTLLGLLQALIQGLLLLFAEQLVKKSHALNRSEFRAILPGGNDRNKKKLSNRWD